jgi:hypothetical protein
MGKYLKEVLGNCYRPKKIAVCVPWGSPFIWMHPAFNLMNLNRPEGVDVKYINGMGRDPAARHMWGVKRGIEWGATHICFLGADQLHPMNILEKFCTHMENGWPACTALVPIRGRVVVEGIERPFQKAAWKLKNGDKPRVAKFDTRHLSLVDPKDGPLQEIVCIGSGALMFDVGLLHALEKPWFREGEPDEEGFRAAKMDTTFTWRLCTEAQGKILADLTIDIQHLDVFPIDETYGERFADWTKEKRT